MHWLETIPKKTSVALALSALLMGWFAPVLPPALQVAGIVASGIIFMFAMWTLYVHRSTHKPPLLPSLSFEKSKGYIHNRKHHETNDDCVAFRVRVTVPEYVRNAVPCMLLQRWDWESGDWGDSISGDNRIQLWWQGSSTDEHIRPRSFSGDDYILLLDYNRRTEKLRFYNSAGYSGYRTIRDDIPSGQYKITIRVDGEFLMSSTQGLYSIGKVFVLDWNGNIDDVEIRTVS